MAPTERTVVDSLRRNVQKIYHSDQREILSVNLVRSKVEADLDLENGYLKTALWKNKSKSIILEENDRLIDAENSPGVKAEPPTVSNPLVEEEDKFVQNHGIKRSTEDRKQQPKKRQKRDDAPESDFEESDRTPPGDSPEQSDDENVERKANEQKQKRKPYKKRSDDDEDSYKKTKVKSKPKSSLRGKVKAGQRGSMPPQLDKKSAKIGSSDEEAELRSKFEDSKPKGEGMEERNDAPEDSDSDLSSLIDEEPQRKPKNFESKAGAKSSKVSTKLKAPSSLSPDEAEIKLLQSQLVKCGIRKIWGIELKKFGDDSKAKIRHLKSMLREAGIEGRFSESRAREIKEARELAADLEAVTEGNQLWGKSRESRNKAARRSFKGMETDDGDEEDQDDDSRSLGSESAKPVRQRIARAKADLAFLGSDDEDSESD